MQLSHHLNFINYELLRSTIIDKILLQLLIFICNNFTISAVIQFNENKNVLNVFNLVLQMQNIKQK